MNTITVNKPGSAWGRKLLTGVLAAGLLLGLTACRATHQVRGSVEESGFLKDYSQLREGESGEAKLLYVNTNADWAKFTRVNLQPVELWKSDDPESPLGKLSQEKQQMLVDYAFTTLSNNLSKNFLFTDQMGPDVLVVHGAITEAKKCKPVINLVSTVMPIGIAISLVKRGIFGTGSGVGICQGEVELLDGGTGARVAAAVDRRAGTKAIRTKFDGRFGDVKLAMDYWAERLDERLMQFRQGKFNGEE
jgi:hypothetical protein